MNPEVDAAAAVRAATDVPYGRWRCPYPCFSFTLFFFYFLIQWQEVHCIIYSSINRGCNKNLKSHHTTDDHLHMKNKAIECQEGKVGGCKFQQLLGRCVCDDIWTHTHTHRSTNSPPQCRLYLQGWQHEIGDVTPRRPQPVPSSRPTVWCWAAQ